jgi:[acyl-carrier-protein] S-malonyltransferase
MAASAFTAFLFPGQGAQTVGMGSDLYTNSPAGRRLFDEADSVLGFPLSSLILNGPSDELTLTKNAQPAIFTVSIALLRAMEEQLGNHMPTPTLMAGHSLGEYTALAAASAISFSEGLRLVQSRGELMQTAGEAIPSGMAAVLGLELNEVLAICSSTGVQLANANSSGQSVISGPNEALANASALALNRGARRVVPLDVSGAFHSEVMRPAQAEIDRILQGISFQEPLVPIIANTSALPITTSEGIRQELAGQLCGPVLWQQSVEYMAAQGIARFIEIGPGAVLTGLTKRTAPKAELTAISSLETISPL